MQLEGLPLLRATGIARARRDLIHLDEMNPRCVTHAMHQNRVADMNCRSIRDIEALGADRNIRGRDGLPGLLQLAAPGRALDDDEIALFLAGADEHRTVF